MRGMGLALVVLLLAGCTSPPEPAVTAPCEGTFLAAVSHIVDGDTLDVQDCGRVRLALVDTPERGEAGFAEASVFTEGLCPAGSPATVDRDAGQERDVYGRLVAMVLCAEKNLNAELMRSGHAVILTAYCAKSEFADEPWAAEACSKS